MQEKLIPVVNRLSDLLMRQGLLLIIRKISVILALSFFIAYLIVYQLYEMKWVSFHWPQKIPHDPYFGVYIAFTFILYYEVLSMIFVLPRSIADSIGKQYEIMSLIILRAVFEHVGEYQHMVETFTSETVEGWDWHALENLIAGTFGSVLLFFLIRVYYKIQKHTRITRDPDDFAGFVAIKKIVALLLLVIFLVLSITGIYGFGESIFAKGIDNVHITHMFFEDIFTSLIFVDILLVLVTTRYSSSYHVVFRNSGLTISTVILRMSFSSSVLVSVTMATMAVLTGIGMSYVYHQFQKQTGNDSKKADEVV